MTAAGVFRPWSPARALARLVAARRATAAFAVAAGVVALHVLRRQLLRPDPGRRCRPPRQRFRPTRRACRGWRRVRAPSRRGTRHDRLLVGFFAVLPDAEAVHYTERSARPATITPGCSRSRRPPVDRSRRRDAVEVTECGRLGVVALRPPGLVAAGTAFVAVAVLLPLAVAYVVTHAARPYVPAADLTPPTRTCSSRPRSSAAQGLVHPVQTARRDLRSPAARLRRCGQSCSPVTATACCSSPGLNSLPHPWRQCRYRLRSHPTRKVKQN